MKKLLLALAFAAGIGFTSSAANAQTCVNNLFSGLVYNASCCECQTTKNMKLVIHLKNNAWVSYSEGSFRKEANGTAKSIPLKQLFSDRSFFRGWVGGWQQFDSQYPDSHTVTVTTGGAISVTNHTWGFTTNLTASCDGNLITGSNAGERSTFSFAPAQPLVC